MNERGAAGPLNRFVFTPKKKTVQQQQRQQRQHTNASNVNKHHQYRPLTQ